MVAWARTPDSRFGVLQSAAGCARFLVEFNNPGVGSPILFTAGLVGYAVCSALHTPR